MEVRSLGLISSLAHKVSWRLGLLRKAFLMRECVDWGSVFKDIISSHRDSHFFPINLIESKEGFGLYQVEDKRFWFPLNFDTRGLDLAYWEIFVDKCYEYGACRIRPGDWVIDAGACEGFFSLYALERGANVIAFEPIPELAKALELTLQDYINAGRAKVLPYGLGKDDEEKEMLIFEDFVGSSTFSMEKATHWALDTSSCRRGSVKVTSLDRLLKDGLLPPVSFIKADVEGYERELLLGARDLISKYRPRLSICTYHLPDDLIEILKIVKEFGLDYSIKLVTKDETFKLMYAW